MAFVRRCGVLVVFMAGACSLYSATNPPGEGGGEDAGLDGSAPPTDGGAESASDVAVGVDASGDADALGGFDLLQNGDFEMTGCVGWNTGGAMTTSMDQSSAHGGAHACNVCGSGTIWDLHQSVSTSVPAGGRYAGSVWVRAGNLSATMPVQVVVKAGDGSQMTALQTIDTTWTQLAPAVVTANVGGTLVSMQIAAGGNGCIDIDDATIVQVP